MTKPNIVLLTIDTLRADVLGCYGYGRPLTPHLDRLAATGVRFAQAITGGSWTQAAFPVLLTSTAAAKYGGCLDSLNAERPSPIEALAAHGYTTAGFSTNPHLSRATGYNRDFATFVDLQPAESDPWLRQLKGGERLLRQPLTHYLAGLLGITTRPARIYASAGELVDKFGHWLAQVDGPFFAWAHFMDVHWPYYLEEQLSHPRQIAAAWEDLALMHRWANAQKKEVITKDLRQRFLNLYEESLQYLDGEIGRLLAGLEAAGYGSNTIVIVISDHGEEFFDHGRWGHWEDNLYDEIVKVPLLIHLPGQPQAQVVHQQVSALDIMPTILELGDCPLPDGVEGTSLRPLWTKGVGSQDGEMRSVICEMPRETWHRVAVRTEAFKLIWDSRCPDQPELYNLQGDPGEQDNVAHEFPQVTRQLMAEVDGHLREVAETRPDGPVQEVEFDEAVLQRLRDLGYVD